MPFMRILRRKFAAIAATISAAASAPSAALAADGWPAAVDANYEINFNGLNVGTYHFRSAQEGQTYKLSSDAKLSLLLGALRWSGTTQATGKVSGEQARPATFGFDYQTQAKKGSTQMAFTEDTVTQVLHDPPPKIKEGIVPVQQAHLKGVLDPLSAVLAISRATGADPCNRRIPVYDGYQRFDLVMSSKGQVRLEETGAGTTGFACRVKYIPIAGHKPDDNTKFMAQNTGIEIILRPMPGTPIFIPHQITIPTMLGSAALVARKVRVTMDNQRQYALASD